MSLDISYFILSWYVNIQTKDKLMNFVGNLVIPHLIEKSFLQPVQELLRLLLYQMKKSPLLKAAHHSHMVGAQTSDCCMIQARYLQSIYNSNGSKV